MLKTSWDSVRKVSGSHEGQVALWICGQKDSTTPTPCFHLTGTCGRTRWYLMDGFQSRKTHVPRLLQRYCAIPWELLMHHKLLDQLLFLLQAWSSQEPQSPYRLMIPSHLTHSLWWGTPHFDSFREQRPTQNSTWNCKCRLCGSFSLFQSIPSNQHAVLPRSYCLFAMIANGVPSVAHVVWRQTPNSVPTTLITPILPSATIPVKPTASPSNMPTTPRTTSSASAPSHIPTSTKTKKLTPKPSPGPTQVGCTSFLSSKPKPSLAFFSSKPSPTHWRANFCTDRDANHF